MGFIEKLKELKRNKKVMTYYTKEDSLRRAGLEEEIERGMEKGIEKGVEQTAINMLKDGMSPDVVQKYTKLSLNKIKNMMTML